jgi:hypothetical protein
VSFGAAAATILGAVFLVAGGSKVVAGRRWLVQASELGVPGLVARIVPWVEIVLGAALAAQLARTVASVCAVVLLVAFSVLLGVRLRQGQRPVCACFGTWSATPLSWHHMARNAVLIGVAVVAAGA